MGGICSMHRSGEEFIQYFGRKTGKLRDKSEDLGLGGSIILEWILIK